MSQISNPDAVKWHLDERHRRAARARLARQFTAGNTRRQRTRDALATLLISTGERLRRNDALTDALTCCSSDRIAVGTPS